MAGVAQKRRKVLDHLRVARPVRIMTADTVVLYGFVYEIEFLQLILHDDVAGKTKLGLRGN